MAHIVRLRIYANFCEIFKTVNRMKNAGNIGINMTSMAYSPVYAVALACHTL